MAATSGGSDRANLFPDEIPHAIADFAGGTRGKLAVTI